MKDKKTNVWVPVTIIMGILLVALIVLTVVMVVTGRSAGNTGSSSNYHADSTQSDVKPQDSDPYLQDTDLDAFSIGESSDSDDSSSSDNAQAAEAAMEDSDGYILPNSDSKKLTKADLEGLTAQQLTYAKNEIYARYGRTFKSSELQDYFNGKDWYEPNEDFKDEDLSKKEADNAEFIATYQKDNDLEYKPAK